LSDCVGAVLRYFVQTAHHPYHVSFHLSARAKLRSSA
jgi:hypothetical protein